MFYFIIPVFKGEDRQGDNKGYKAGFYVSGNTSFKSKFFFFIFLFLLFLVFTGYPVTDLLEVQHI